MPARKELRKGRIFSIELDSGNDLKKVSVPNGSRRILLEGTIGTLREAMFVEDSVLQLVGSGGVLRVDLSREDLAKTTRGHRGVRQSDERWN
jgi:hypothetical protein